MKPAGYFVDDDGGFQKVMDYWIGAMAFTPDAKTLITGSRDQTIKLFDMPHVTEQRTLKGHTGWVRSFAVTADSKVLISAGDDSQRFGFGISRTAAASERSRPTAQPFAALPYHRME